MPPSPSTTATVPRNVQPALDVAVAAPATYAATPISVSVYADDAIYSHQCTVRSQYFYAALRGAWLRINCTGSATVFQYGFRPQRARGAIQFQVWRKGDIAESRERCGLIMVDQGEEGAAYVALDCRNSR